MIDSASRESAASLASGPAGVAETGDGEKTLFHAQGVLVTSERLVTGGRTWLIEEIQRVESIRRGPRVLPLLVTLVLGVVLGLPMLSAVMASSGGRWFYDAALVVSAAAIFGSIAGLLSIGDTYWLVLWTQQHERRVLRSRDQRLISRIADVVARAAAAARQEQ